MAGFAGSQRGDRRRRRLAADTDERGSEIAPSAEPTVLRPRVDAAHAEGKAAETSAVTLPLSAIVPVAWWSYLSGALACLALGAGIVSAGQHASGSTSAEADIWRLFALPDAPVARWYSGLLLTLSAQLACLIWWVRSKSTKDFNGRYWLWVRVACLWLAQSCCLVTDANTALVAAARGNWPAAPWWVITPVSVLAVGVWTVRALSREMGGCRVSRCVLLAAGGAYLTAAAFGFERYAIVPADARPALVQATLLLGHIGVFLSMWLHARHVVHCTADPATSSGRRWKLPRPHMRLARWRLPRLERALDDRAVALEKAQLQGQRDEPVVAPSKVGVAEEENSGGRRVAKSAAAKPRFRIDARHRGFLSSGGDPNDASPAFGENPAPPDEEPVPAASVRIQEPSAIERPGARSDEVAVEVSDETEDANAPTTVPSKPDLRGLSKKQRRRLMQEHRQRERDLGH